MKKLNVKRLFLVLLLSILLPACGGSGEENPANQSPVANDDSFTVNEGSSSNLLQVTSNDTDAEGALDLSSIIITAGPGQGSATAYANGSIAYTHDGSETTSDSLSYTIADTSGAVSAPATVHLSIIPVNDAPVALSQSVTTTEGDPVDINLGSDVEGDTLSNSIIDAPEHGSLSGTGASVTYTPDPYYHGMDSFSFTLNDGSVDSSEEIVTLTIGSVNDAPVAVSQTISTHEDSTVQITLGSDIDGDALSHSIITAPQHGSLSGSGALVTYTPAGNYNGSDSFSFRLNDGTVNSNEATISLSITAVNDAPVATTQSITTNEDTAVLITLGSDIDGDALSNSIIDAPDHGILSGSGGSIIYTPAANYNGMDSFSFTLNDGTASSSTEIITLTIAAVNDAPVADSQDIATNEDVAVQITLGSDIDGDALSHSIITAPQHGTLSGSGALISYTPAADYNGSDSFRFRLNDGTVNSSEATISLSIAAVNDAPEARSQGVTTSEDTPVEITLGSDVDGDSLTHSVTGPSNGSLSGSGASLSYTPNLNYNGIDSFSFTLNDGTADSSEEIITLTVTAVNDAPVADSQSIATDEDTSVLITLGSDVDGDTLSHTITVAPAHGTLNGTGAAVNYEPDLDYTGLDSFSFSLNDGSLDSNTATITLVVTAHNDAPVAVADSGYSVNEGGTLNVPASGVLANDSDAEGSNLSAVLDTNVSNGSLTLNADGSFVYVHDGTETTSDSFTYHANDGALNSTSVSVSITINPVNDAPVAVADSGYSVAEGGTLNIPASGVLANDSDAEGTSLTAVLDAGVSNGSLTLNADGSFVYVHDGSETTSDSFTYHALDGALNSTSVSVSITINPVNDAPVAVADSGYSVEEGGTLNVPTSGVLTNDSDAEGSGLSAVLDTNVSNGSLSLNTDGSFEYVHDGSETTSDSFSYHASDGVLSSSSVSVSISITPVNDAPVANNDSFTVNEGSSNNTLNLAANDNDAEAELDLTSIVIITGPVHGSVSINANGTIDYTHDGSETTSDTLSYTIADASALVSETASVSLSITPQNDDPVVTSQSLTTSEDAPVMIVLGSDADGDSLSHSITASPARGVISGTGATIIYTPDADVSGSDSFSFVLNDGTVDSATGTISITINAVNDAPIANDASINTSAGKSDVTGTLTASDVENDNLTYQLLTPPTKGSVTLDNAATGAFTYTPEILGDDSFTFSVIDDAASGARESSVARITVNAPVALTVPAIPINELASAGDQRVSLRWDSVDYAETYNVYWSVTPGVTPATGTLISVTQPEYHHDDRINNTPYYYIVTAVNAEGESAASGEMSATPVDIAIAGLVFADVNLDACVSNTASTAGVTYVHQLTELRCNASGISDLTGIEQLSGLTILTLDSNSFTDINPVGNLTQLTYLTLNGDPINGDISALADLTGLWTLGLANTGTTDISPLSDMSNLINLYAPNVNFYPATYNRISNLEPLSGKTGLRGLTLTSNNISDISPLSGMVNMETLVLDTNYIRDISALSGMTALTELRVAANDIFDVSVLPAATGLATLSLFENNIYDIERLSILNGLTLLELFSNHISDVTPLSGLSGLQSLFLAHNQVSDVSPLASLLNINTLWIRANPIGGQGVGHVDALVTLSQATSINLTENPSMSCAELTTLISALGEGVVNPAIADPGVNCTAP